MAATKPPPKNWQDKRGAKFGRKAARPAPPDPKPGQHTPGKTFTAPSKAHGGKQWVYKTTASGKVNPVRAKSTKPTTTSKPAAAPAAAAPRPYGEYTDAINSAANDQFAGQEAQAQAGQGVAEQHAKDLEVVYDRFKNQLLGQDDALRAQQNATVAQAQAQQAASIQGLGQAMGQGAAGVAQTAKESGGPDLSGTVANIGGAGAAGANAVSQPAVTALGAQQGVQRGLVQQLGSLMDLERGRQGGVAAQQVQDWKTKRIDISGKKGAEKQADYKDRLATAAKALQQQFDNELASATLLSDKQKIKKDFDAKMADITAKMKIASGLNATAKTVAGIKAGATVKGATIAADASIEGARLRSGATITGATIAANARRDAAKIGAKAKGGPKGPVTMTTADGKQYVMTEAERKEWLKKRTFAISVGGKLKSAMQTERDVGKAIKRVKAAVSGGGYAMSAAQITGLVNAAKGKPMTAQERNSLRPFFPHGIIPPGFVDGTGIH